MADYAATRARVETYFDRTATRVWERLTSDAPVSRIRQTVREGRASMRGLILSRLPTDLAGARVLDAGCGPGVMTAELAARGATVVAADISPQLIAIARARMPAALRGQVTFHAGDMTDARLGSFDHVVAMDSLIYYAAPDIARIVTGLRARTAGKIVFTVAPRTPLLSLMWQVGRLFPRADRAPVLQPHSAADLTRRLPGLTRAGRIARGFYISECLEVAP
jgi:magnesium-protoporphyrin O-methyltransferase